MSQFVESACRTFTAGAAIAQYLRVKMTASKLAVAGNTDLELGTMEVASFADGDLRAVRLRSAQGTAKFVAVDAIAKGGNCFAAASGKVSAGGGVLIGTALEASATDGDVIEVLRAPITESTQVLAAAGSVQADAGVVTLVASGIVHATGADATKGIVLPLASPGMRIMVKNADAANAILKVYPNTGDAINAIAVNSPISMAAKTCAVFEAIDSTTWFTAPLLPS